MRLVLHPSCTQFLEHLRGALLFEQLQINSPKACVTFSNDAVQYNATTTTTTATRTTASGIPIEVLVHRLLNRSMLDQGRHLTFGSSAHSTCYVQVRAC
jgi:hypothetical protein